MNGRKREGERERGGKGRRDKEMVGESKRWKEGRKGNIGRGEMLVSGVILSVH